MILGPEHLTIKSSKIQSEEEQGKEHNMCYKSYPISFPLTTYRERERERKRRKKAVEGIVQMSTISANARACMLQAHFLPFSSKEKLNLATCKGLKNTTISLSSSSSSSSSPVVPMTHNRGSRIICKAQNTTNEVLAVTDSSWTDLVIGSETPVLVEFWAPWCGPCRMIAPVIDELAKEYAGKIACCKLNTDDCPAIATQYGIRSIPTVLVFKNGEKKESVIGAVPKSTLTATIEKYVGA